MFEKDVNMVNFDEDFLNNCIKQMEEKEADKEGDGDIEAEVERIINSYELSFDEDDFPGMGGDWDFLYSELCEAYDSKEEPSEKERFAVVTCKKLSNLRDYSKSLHYFHGYDGRLEESYILMLGFLIKTMDCINKRIDEREEVSLFSTMSAQQCFFLPYTRIFLNVINVFKREQEKVLSHLEKRYEECKDGLYCTDLAHAIREKYGYLETSKGVLVTETFLRNCEDNSDAGYSVKENRLRELCGIFLADAVCCASTTDRDWELAPRGKNTGYDVVREIVSIIDAGLVKKYDKIREELVQSPREIDLSDILRKKEIEKMSRVLDVACSVDNLNGWSHFAKVRKELDWEVRRIVLFLFLLSMDDLFATISGSFFVFARFFSDAFGMYMQPVSTNTHQICCLQNFNLSWSEKNLQGQSLRTVYAPIGWEVFAAHAGPATPLLYAFWELLQIEEPVDLNLFGIYAFTTHLMQSISNSLIAIGASYDAGKTEMEGFDRLIPHMAKDGSTRFLCSYGNANMDDADKKAVGIDEVFFPTIFRLVSMVFYLSELYNQQVFGRKNSGIQIDEESSADTANTKEAPAETENKSTTFGGLMGEVERLKKENEKLQKKISHLEELARKKESAKEETCATAEEEVLRHRIEYLERKLAEKTQGDAQESVLMCTEEEFYPGELQEYLLDALKKSINQMPDGRKKDLLNGVLRAYPNQKDALEKKREQVKRIFGNYDGLSKPLVSALKDIGIEMLDKDGAHPQICLSGDTRYHVTFAATPSDVAGGKNIAALVNRLFF